MVMREIFWVLLAALLLRGVLPSSSAGDGPAADISRRYGFDIVAWEMTQVLPKAQSLGRRLLAQPQEATCRDKVAAFFATPKRNADQRAAVEDCIEAVVARVLVEEGLTVRFPLAWPKLTLPPVLFVLSPPPQVLAISPREQILLERALFLRPGLDLATIAAIEGEIERAGKSALVEPLGGFSAYPSLVQEGTSLEFAVATVAHEWAHHHLFFRPLGQHYYDNPAMASINETAADIVGREIGEQALLRLAGKQPAEPAPSPSPPEGRTSFDFAREMREIRKAVEAMLTQGKVGEAEAYMNERREYLAANGFPLRRLNQAYFAFHGTYAESPASISPIGGQLRRLRQQSASLGEFVKQVSQIAKPEDLDQMTPPQATR